MIFHFLYLIKIFFFEVRNSFCYLQFVGKFKIGRSFHALNTPKMSQIYKVFFITGVQLSYSTSYHILRSPTSCFFRSPVFKKKYIGIRSIHINLAS